MPMSTKTLGNWGEDSAVKFLKKKRYRILERNWKADHKEIDIIAQRGRAIIFVEVKTLSMSSPKNPNRFLPEESIGPQKRKKLLLACKYYLFSKKIPLDTSWQIDVISVEADDETKKVKIHHFENELY
ncbi:MAG: endonuclease [Parcubacteria group bacterium CG11_big_fil_rev_8_21_14_0_20_39_14]|nr:MAG: endonuclease [Parcubacteria group bacterium CG11_big_fil_rev_8_21_14_0_20_39_14]PIS35344.1 MAG: endonuclease [Parcubacteria group bacterium CG08_land_8_20_14_0_20_38_56]